MDSPIRAAALIPCYNNARTISDVLERTLAVIPDVLVVDDGCTDGSSEAIEKATESWGTRIRSLRHSTNLGKGRALRDGLGQLAAAGFSHAIALDADGQHYPEDIPVLLEAARRFPDAIIVGERNLREARAPLASRFGLWCSNSALRLFRGVKIGDSQSGFRAYPLSAIVPMDLRADRYDFEMEVLFAAARAGITIQTVPVRVTYEPPGGRVSSFRPIRDFLRVASCVARLLRR